MGEETKCGAEYAELGSREDETTNRTKARKRPAYGIVLVDVFCVAVLLYLLISGMSSPQPGSLSLEAGDAQRVMSVFSSNRLIHYTGNLIVEFTGIFKGKVAETAGRKP